MQIHLPFRGDEHDGRRGTPISLLVGELEVETNVFAPLTVLARVVPRAREPEQIQGVEGRPVKRTRDGVRFTFGRVGLI